MYGLFTAAARPDDKIPLSPRSPAPKLCTGYEPRGAEAAVSDSLSKSLPHRPAF